MSLSIWPELMYTLIEYNTELKFNINLTRRKIIALTHLQWYISRATILVSHQYQKQHVGQTRNLPTRHMSWASKSECKLWPSVAPVGQPATGRIPGITCVTLHKWLKYYNNSYLQVLTREWCSHCDNSVRSAADVHFHLP